MPQHTLDATKDPLDLRDLLYEGNLVELPPWVDNRGKVPFILDQGQEGACTGFGLAAVVNFLQHNRSGAMQLERPKGASARMLYEMAKRYDEWEGSDYEGSSIRGAMKGWHKHGVCNEGAWPNKSDKKPRLTPKRQIDALECPLGNYYRVRHLHLSHVHAALAEVGILYASASVHSGWNDPDPETGRIRYRNRRDVDGGHAFAIVGYDQNGLWIQNSWGRDWGLSGFGHITYDDWFENGFDCWVARTGVVTRSIVLDSGGESLQRVQSFDYVPHEAAVFASIRPHLVNLGNDGLLSDSGRYQTDARDVVEIFQPTRPGSETTSFADKAAEWSGTPRLMLYAHGGLNNEASSATRIASMRPYWLANEIYPLHFMWETGVRETLRSIVADVFNHRRFGGIWSSVKDRMRDLGDEAVELAIRGVGKPVWGEMQENARLASHDGHGADIVAGRIADYQANDGDLELHLVGHSAGSILLAHLIPVLSLWGLSVKSLTLYAPACSTALFRENVLPYFGRGNGIERITIFNLDDDAERDDTVTKVYNKSLLYLVSEALDRQRKQPLLGMQRFIEHADEGIIAEWNPTIQHRGTTVIYTKGGPKLKIGSTSDSHGGFDNDVPTLNSTVRIIRGGPQLVRFPR